MMNRAYSKELDMTHDEMVTTINRIMEFADVKVLQFVYFLLQHHVANAK